jgi:hypothetical protein
VVPSLIGDPPFAVRSRKTAASGRHSKMDDRVAVVHIEWVALPRSLSSRAAGNAYAAAQPTAAPFSAATALASAMIVARPGRSHRALTSTAASAAAEDRHD